MSAIIFDQELRQFSVVNYQAEYADADKKWTDHFVNNSRAWITGGSAALGAGAGAAIARHKAIKKAKAAGMTDAEAKAMGKKAMLKGAAIGGAAGAGASELARLGTQAYKGAKEVHNNIKDKDLKFKNRLQGYMYGAKDRVTLKGKKWGE